MDNTFIYGYVVDASCITPFEEAFPGEGTRNLELMISTALNKLGLYYPTRPFHFSVPRRLRGLYPSSESFIPPDRHKPHFQPRFLVYVLLEDKATEVTLTNFIEQIDPAILEKLVAALGLTDKELQWHPAGFKKIETRLEPRKGSV